MTELQTCSLKMYCSPTDQCNKIGDYKNCQKFIIFVKIVLYCRYSKYYYFMF